MWMKSHFHMKGWAPRLALRKSLKVIRKWPIRSFIQLLKLAVHERWLFNFYPSELFGVPMYSGYSNIIEHDTSWGIESDTKILEISKHQEHLLKIKFFASILRCNFTQLVFGLLS